MKTKKEFSQKVAGLTLVVKQYTEDYEKARSDWRKSRYEDDEAYRRYCELESALKSAQRDLAYYSLLAGDAPIFANQAFYTDWEPWEVIEIKTDLCLIVRKMKAELTDEGAKGLQDSFIPGGFFGHFDNGKQRWTISSDPEGEVATIRRHKCGTFHIAGEKGSRFYIEAEPYKYYDYNF